MAGAGSWSNFQRQEAEPLSKPDGFFGAIFNDSRLSLELKRPVCDHIEYLIHSFIHLS